MNEDAENLSDESVKEYELQTKTSGYNIMVLDNKEPSKKDAELHFIQNRGLLYNFLVEEDFEVSKLKIKDAVHMECLIETFNIIWNTFLN